MNDINPYDEIEAFERLDPPSTAERWAWIVAAIIIAAGLLALAFIQ